MTIDVQSLAQRIINELDKEAGAAREKITGVVLLYEKIKEALEADASSSDKSSGSSEAAESVPDQK